MGRYNSLGVGGRKKSRNHWSMPIKGQKVSREGPVAQEGQSKRKKKMALKPTNSYAQQLGVPPGYLIVRSD